MTKNLEIITAKVSELIEDPANARRHTLRNMQAIEASLKRFGQVEPLVVQKSTQQVIGGNGRLTAMKELGWEECQVVEIDVDSMEATAIAIALNRTSELAEWDIGTLAPLLEKLPTEAVVGFDQVEIEELGKNLDWAGVSEEELTKASVEQQKKDEIKDNEKVFHVVVPKDAASEVRPALEEIAEMHGGKVR